MSTYVGHFSFTIKSEHTKPDQVGIRESAPEYELSSPTSLSSSTAFGTHFKSLSITPPPSTPKAIPGTPNVMPATPKVIPATPRVSLETPKVRAETPRSPRVPEIPSPSPATGRFGTLTRLFKKEGITLNPPVTYTALSAGGDTIKWARDAFRSAVEPLSDAYFKDLALFRKRGKEGWSEERWENEEYNYHLSTFKADLNRSTMIINGEPVKKDEYGQPITLQIDKSKDPEAEYKKIFDKFLDPKYPELVGLHQGISLDASNFIKANFGLKGVRTVRKVDIVGREMESGEGIRPKIIHKGHLKKGKKETLENPVVKGLFFNSQTPHYYRRDGNNYACGVNDQLLYALHVQDNQGIEYFLVKNKHDEWELLSGTAFSDLEESTAALFKKHGYKPIGKYSIATEIDYSGLEPKIDLEITVQTREPELQYLGPRPEDVIGIEMSIPGMLEQKQRVETKERSATPPVSKAAETSVAETPKLKRIRSKSLGTEADATALRDEIDKLKDQNKEKEIKLDEGKPVPPTPRSPKKPKP